MDKTNTGIDKEKDSFKNAPHAPAPGSSDRSAERSSGFVSGSSFGDAKNAIREQARPAVDYVKSNLEPVLENSRVYLGDAEALIKRHPFYAIAGATAIGACIGMMISRPSQAE